MIFRSPDYSETTPNKELESIIKHVFDFVTKIAPTTKIKQIQKIEDNLAVIVCDNTLVHKYLNNGTLQNQKLTAAAHCFWTNIDTEKGSADQGLAFRSKGIDEHKIAHETLHAFSSELGKTSTGGYIKRGSHYATTKANFIDTIENQGSVLNEAITEALASRFRGTVGPGPGAGYGSLVLLADLLIGEKLENNLFLQDVYWGLGNKFAKDFDKTVQTSQVKFTDYLKPFVICGTPEDNLKSDDLLHGAIEYNLKKATSTQEIDQVYKFQEKIITFYRDGFISTGIVEDQDIERMNNLIQFANKIYKKSKLDILNKKTKNTGNTPSARTTTRTI